MINKTERSRNEFAYFLNNIHISSQSALSETMCRGKWNYREYSSCRSDKHPIDKTHSKKLMQMVRSVDTIKNLAPAIQDLISHERKLKILHGFGMMQVGLNWI